VLYVRMPAMGPAAAAANASLTSAAVASRPSTTARSVSDPSSIGTRTATPSSFPATAGMTTPVARAAPVVVVKMTTASARTRCREQYLPGPALQVQRRAVAGAELAGRLDHDVGVEPAPVDRGRVPLGQHRDRGAANDQRVRCVLHGAANPSVGRVERQQVRQR